MTVDELAQIIRRVDGNHSLGAGELAEAILAALSPPIKAGEAVPVMLRAAEAFNEEHGDPADTLHHGRGMIEAMRAALYASPQPEAYGVRVTDRQVEAAAWAILLVRFYNPEPEMYASLDAFYTDLRKSDHWADALAEARAALEAALSHTEQGETKP